MQPFISEANLGPYKYKVRYNEALIDEGMKGNVLLLQHVIELRPGMCAEEEKKTIVHELLHAWLRHMGIGDHTEQVMDMMAFAYFLIREGNPSL